MILRKSVFLNFEKYTFQQLIGETDDFAPCLLRWVNSHNHTHLFVHFVRNYRNAKNDAVMGFLGLKGFVHTFKKPRPLNSILGKVHFPNWMVAGFLKNHAPLIQYFKNAEKHSGHVFDQNWSKWSKILPGTSVILRALFSIKYLCSQNDASSREISYFS